VSASNLKNQTVYVLCHVEAPGCASVCWSMVNKDSELGSRTSPHDKYLNVLNQLRKDRLAPATARPLALILSYRSDDLILTTKDQASKVIIPYSLPSPKENGTNDKYSVFQFKVSCNPDSAQISLQYLYIPIYALIHLRGTRSHLV
jgi:hypothetical protein